MTAHALRRVAGGLLVAVALVPRPGPVPACAPAPPANKPVAIADESAIILWDQESKTEHFIRRASFSTEAQDFGFLVPTPTRPTLEAASDEAFSELAKLTAPEVITQKQPAGGGCIGCTAGAPPPAGMAAPVRVLDEKRVAGHDAAVLEADDAAALSQWLKDHGYDFSPALTAWADPYVKAGWKITAFKIAKKTPEDRDVATSAVRMTFQTDRPFFPYREPQGPPSEGGQRDSSPGSSHSSSSSTGSSSEGSSAATPAAPAKVNSRPARLLRVFFIAAGRVEGALGQEGQEGKPWPGEVAWANRVPPELREKLLGLLKLPAQAPPASWWLTEFEDHSSPRPGTADVFFSPSRDQTPVARPPHIRYVSSPGAESIPYAALAVCLVAPYCVRSWRRWRRCRG